jgi:hydroxymethylpyrimidine/phosphomethylpyrimidine kinase
VLCTGTATHRWRHTRVAEAHTHGAGCILAAALAAHLASGTDLVAACERAIAFVHDALVRGARRPAPHLADIEHATCEVSALTRST